jgi:hypothetical protein
MAEEFTPQSMGQLESGTRDNEELRVGEDTLEYSDKYDTEGNDY